MRTLFLIALVISPSANAATVVATLKECLKGNDHARVTQCVVGRAKSARGNLEAAERAMRVKIKKSSDDVSYVNPVRQRFEASILSYRRYRGEQCGLYQTLSNMSVYNEEIKLACEAMLDSDRAQQLKQGINWLD
jgi:hypothetical protein